MLCGYNCKRDECIDSWANHVVIIKCSVEPDHSYFTAIQLNKCSKAAVFPSLSSLFLSLSPFFASPHWCNIRAYSSFVTYSKNIQKVIEYFQQVTFPEFVAQALPLYNFSLENKSLFDLLLHTHYHFCHLSLPLWRFYLEFSFIQICWAPLSRFFTKLEAWNSFVCAVGYKGVDFVEV